MNIAEAARLLGVNVSTVHRYVRKGKLSYTIKRKEGGGPGPKDIRDFSEKDVLALGVLLEELRNKGGHYVTDHTKDKTLCIVDKGKCAGPPCTSCGRLMAEPITVYRASDREREES